MVEAVARMIIPLPPGATMTPTPNGYIITGGWMLGGNPLHTYLNDKRSSDGLLALFRRWIG